jgi:alanine dehydrogenase
MRVGVPKEIKDHEDRVGLVPSSVAELVLHGHEVLVERGAGVGAGLGDDQYTAAGARIVDSAEEVFAQSEMIVKVKEPLAVERKRLRRGQVLFTYLHLAPDREQTEDLIKSGVTAIAYETVTSPTGTLPLLTPMSEVAGRLAPQVGARYLERAAGGRGVLLGGVPGVPPAEVVVLAAACRARMPPPSRSAWAPRCSWSIARPRCCAVWRRSSPACAPSSPRAMHSAPSCAAPTFWSAPCWSPELPRQNWSRARWWPR